MTEPIPSRTQDKGEIILAAVVATASISLPVVGVLGGLVFALASTNSRRTETWMRHMQAAVEELQRVHDRSPEALVEDPHFVDAVYRLTASALTSHQEEKLRALQAALVVIGAGQLEQAHLNSFVVAVLDSLTPVHFEVILFVAANLDQLGSLRELEEAFILYSQVGHLGRPEFRLLMRDLESKQLLSLADVYDYPEYHGVSVATWPSDNNPQPIQITELGSEILKIVRKSKH